MQQLKSAQPQRNQNLRIELGIRMLEKRADAPIQVDLPSQRPKYKSRRQVAVRF